MQENLSSMMSKKLQKGEKGEKKAKKGCNPVIKVL